VLNIDFLRTKALLGGLVLSLAACDAFFPDAPATHDELAGTVDGLTGVQTAQHLRGDEEFARTFGPADGLGPVFVAQSCEACHVGDGKGHPLFGIARFGRDLGGGVFDPMRAAGGPQLQNRAVLGYLAETFPAGVTGVAVFTPPAVSGLGFLEAVDDTTLMALDDSIDANADGISGRLQLVAPNDLLARVVSLDAVATDGPPSRGTLVGGRYIGRFGKKALAVNLLHQIVTAYHQDMGITSDLIPDEIFNPAVGPFTGDGTAEPEVSAAVVNAVVFYVKTLKAPPRRNASAPDVLAGETLFNNGPCASCHLPQLTTGDSPIPALHRVTFKPYTDLLLHDLGAEVDDGYTEGHATMSEWRTAPLWGLGLAAQVQGGQMYLMHDGRAKTIDAAVSFHGGEAAASRAWFNALSVTQRAQLVAFLLSL